MKTLSEARREALARRRQRRAELRKAPPDAKNQLQPFGRLISEIPLSVAVEAAIQKEFDTLELWRRVGFPLPVDISGCTKKSLKKSRRRNSQEKTTEEHEVFTESCWEVC